MYNLNQNIYLPMLKPATVCCPFSNREVYKMCASQNCKTCPFICKFCKNNHCLNQHTHNGGPTLTFLWSDIEETINQILGNNGFYLPEFQQINKAMQSTINRIRVTIESMFSNVRRLKGKAMMKPEFKKIVEKFKNNPNNLTGAEMGRLLDAARKSELWENREEMTSMVKARFARIYALLDQINRKLDQQKDQESEKFKQLLRDGEEQRKSRKYKEALANYTEALSIQPYSDLAYFCKGYVFDDMKEHNKAIEQYTKAIELNKSNSSYWNNRGIALKNLNKFNEAILDYTKAISLNDGHADYYFNRAIAYKGLNEYDKAQEDFNKAIDISPSTSQYYNGRGVYWKTQKLYDKAITDYSKAIELNPDNDDYYSNRGIAYATLKQNDKAILDFDKAIQIKPDDPLHYRNRAVVFDKIGRKAQAAIDRLKSKQLQQPK